MLEASATLVAVRDAARRSWSDLLELALPTSCAACGTFLDGQGAGTMLCEVCDAIFYEARRAPHCAACATPLPDALGPCGRCKGKGVRPFDAIGRLGTFESTVRSLVHAIKYGRRWPIVPWIAKQMIELPRVTAILDQADVLVPVPLHWTRRLTRGFNQSQLLANAIKGKRPIAVASAVRRVRRTPSQTTQPSRAKRRQNLANAFAVTQPDLVSGRRVVLIDDVMTSGATLQSVARALAALPTPPSTLSALVIATANPLHSDLTAV